MGQIDPRNITCYECGKHSDLSVHGLTLSKDLQAIERLIPDYSARTAYRLCHHISIGQLMNDRVIEQYPEVEIENLTSIFMNLNDLAISSARLEASADVQDTTFNKLKCLLLSSVNVSPDFARQLSQYNGLHVLVLQNFIVRHLDDMDDPIEIDLTGSNLTQFFISNIPQQYIVRRQNGAILHEPEGLQSQSQVPVYIVPNSLVLFSDTNNLTGKRLYEYYPTAPYWVTRS